MKTLFILLALFLIVFTVIGVASAATNPQPVSTGAPTNQSSIDGHKMVYTYSITSTNDNDIQMMDLSTNTTTGVNWNCSDSQYPDISGNIVVWQSRETSTSNWQVYYRDLTNSSQNGLNGTLVCGDPDFNQTNPRISGNIVTWQQQYADNDWDICYYNLSTHSGNNAAYSNANEMYPDVSGNTIVYQRYDTYDGTNWKWNVYGYTIGQPTNSGTRLGPNNICNQQHPRIDGDNVVWEQEGSSGVDIWYQGLSSAFLVSSPYQSSNEYLPQISGTTVIWEAEYGNTQFDFMKDCSNNSNPYTTVATLMGVDFESQPAIGIDPYGIFVSYTSNEDGTYRVYWRNMDSTAPTVTANPAGGLYNTWKRVFLSTYDPDSIATTFYTTDGTDPITSSTRNTYTGSGVLITTTTELRFAAVDPASNSNSYWEWYDIDIIIPTVTANPVGGLYNTTKNVVLIPSETSFIYYTTNETTPNLSSNLYTGPISISSTTTLNYIAYDLAGNPSLVYCQTYTIDTTAPTITATPSGGSYNTTKNVILTTTDSNSTTTTYYTTDGSDPQNSSSRHQYINAIPINTTTTLRYAAVDPAGNWNSYTQTYTIDTIAPTASASLTSGLYNVSKYVTLRMSEPGRIYYTKNGATPTTSSARYTASIAITATTILKFFAVDLAGNKSPLYIQKYTIDKIAPKVSSTVPSNLKTGVSRTATISIKFTEKIKASTYWSKIYIKNLKTGKLVSISKGISGNILYIKTSSSRNAYNWYQVTIPAKAIKDYAGNNRATAYTFKFKTGAR